MYKSYEIKDINDKIKYANYSIEKLKLKIIICFTQQMKIVKRL